MKSFIRVFSVAILVPLFAAPVCMAQSEPSDPKIHNLHKVNDHLYRAGQPRAGDIKKLAEMGIARVFLPGSPMKDIIDFVNSRVQPPAPAH